MIARNAGTMAKILLLTSSVLALTGDSGGAPAQTSEVPGAVAQHVSQLRAGIVAFQDRYDLLRLGGDPGVAVKISRSDGGMSRITLSPDGKELVSTRMEQPSDRYPQFEKILNLESAELALILRKNEDAAPMWQIAPSVALQLTDAQLSELLLRRVMMALDCSYPSLGRQRLDLPDDAAEPPEWSQWRPGTVSAGRLHTRDCFLLTDESGNPTLIESVGELEAVRTLQAGIEEVLSSRASLSTWHPSVLQANLAYLQRSAGQETEPNQELAALLGKSVFSAQVTNLTVHVSFDGKVSRLVFVAPLSF